MIFLKKIFHSFICVKIWINLNAKQKNLCINNFKKMSSGAMKFAHPICRTYPGQRNHVLLPV